MCDERYRTIRLKYQNIKAQMQEDLNREFQESYANKSMHPMTKEQYEVAKEETHWDVAW